jgi:hypothetical protein
MLCVSPPTDDGCAICRCPILWFDGSDSILYVMAAYLHGYLKVKCLLSAKTEVVSQK